MRASLKPTITSCQSSVVGAARFALQVRYRSQPVARAGKRPYGAGHRDEWLRRLQGLHVQAGGPPGNRPASETFA